MKALKWTYTLVVGILGGILGGILWGIFWLIHLLVTIARDLWAMIPHSQIRNPKS